MPKPRRWEFVGTKGSVLYLEGRLLLADRSVAQQADIDSISLKFWFEGGLSSAYTATPSVAASIFDTLQTGWDEDETGYNLRLKIPGSEIDSHGPAMAEASIIPNGGDADDAIKCLWKGTIHASNV